MFLIVGEFIKDLEWWRNDGDWWNNIINEFWELMEEKEYIHVKNLTDLSNLTDLTNISCIISRWAHLKYTKEVLSKFFNLKKILLAQVGNDNVDLKYCKQKWIEVKNFISQKSIYSVTEQTVASLIMWARQIMSTWCNMKNWIYSRKPIWKNLEDITIWVMGCGRIGQKVIELLKSFPCKIVTYDIVFWFEKKEHWLVNLENSLHNQWVEIFSDLNKFIEVSNYISVHIPGFDENLWLLNYSKLQNIDWVVNMARAGIVDEEDILKLLDEWKMEFYVSDVVIWEPNIEKINKKLINHNKVFITPHIGANTLQVQSDILSMILEEVKWEKY